MLRPRRAPQPFAAIAPLLLAPLLLPACAPEAADAPHGARAAALSVPPGACDADEPTWIAVAADPGPCPAVPGWIEAPLFTAPAGPLARFCHYTADGGDPADLIAEPGLLDPGPDCGVVAPQSGLDAASGPIWAAAHTARIAPVSPALGPATVAVLDTAGPAGARSPHGPAMVALVERAAAGAAVVPRVALPRVGDGTLDWHGGGHFGSPGELAVALEDAAGLPGPLVVNLSLGWAPVAPMHDGGLGAGHLALLGGGASGIGGPVRAVHAALVDAVCRGALVVAAAGNDPVGAGETGALLPAAWAALEAPSAAECAAAGLSGPGAVVAGRGLVEAVGGVDLADRPLANGRAGSTPRLVAPAEHAAAEVAGEWAVFSGTSAAAASASGAAAAVWNHGVGLSAGAVADALYAGAVDLGALRGPAELCGPAGCPPVRRLSICGAVAQVAPGPSCAPDPAGDGARSSAARAALPAAGAMPITSAASVPAVPDGCGAAGGLCPAPLSTPPAAPWPAVAPQPEWPGCPSCSLDRSSGTLTLEIDRRMPDLDDPVLTVRTPAGAVHFDLSATLGRLSAGRRAKVTGLKLPSGVEGAWMTFTVQGKTTRLAKGNPIAVK